MMLSPAYGQCRLADLKTLLVPALALGQFSIAETGSREKGLVAPVGLVLWASVSPEVDRRLAADPGRTVRLATEEWKSGDILWVMEAVGEPSVVSKILSRLFLTEWRGRSAKIRVKGDDGKPVVRLLSATKSAA